MQFSETDSRFLNKPLADANVLALVNVPPEYRDYIRVVDTDDSLVCLRYLTPLDESGKPDLDILEKIGHVRGTVVDTDTNQIVCRSFPFTNEETIDVTNNNTESKYVGNLVYYKACEGTVLRVYYWNKWRVSTHGKINAEHSYWAGPSFKSLFDDVFSTSETSGDVGEDFNGLNKDLCYMFMLSHPKNKLVYNISNPQILHISTYDRSTDTFHDPSEEGFGVNGIKTPERVYPKNLDELKELVESAKSFDFSGIICFNSSTGQYPDPLKLVSQNYLDIKNIRGNEPSLSKRYLQLRGTREGNVLKEWFTDSADVFTEVEESIHVLAKKLHLMYLDRFVKKNVQQLPKEEFVFLSKCHENYLADRKNIVTFDRVMEQLAKTPYYYVNIMLNR